MRKLAFLAAAALAFGLAPLTMRIGPIPGSLVLVVTGVIFAVAASGALSALSIAGGALGALAGGVLGGVSPWMAGAALAGLCFAERSARVRGRNARILHIGLGLGGGAAAGAINASFATSQIAVHGVAVVVAAVLLALPLLVEADDPMAHALDLASAEVTGAARTSLHEGAELRRTIDEDLLDRKVARNMRQTWASLLRLAEARARLERAAKPREGSPAEKVLGRVDTRIADHVAALSRAYAAADTARAAEVSIDDAALRGVETMGESLEQVSRAIVEDV